MADDTTTLNINSTFTRAILINAIMSALKDLDLPVQDIRRTSNGYKVLVGKEITDDEKAEVIVLIRTIERDAAQPSSS